MKPRGLGRVFQPYYKDRRTGARRQVATWSIEYCYRGRQHREPAGSTNRADAVRLLKRRLGELGAGRFVGRAVEKTTFDDLAEMLLTDFRINGRRSLDRVEDALTHLRGMFAGWRALDLTADRVAAYVNRRQAERAANATINRELSGLKRMFRLGERAGRVTGRPYIALLHEDNVRQGFLDHATFDALRALLPAPLRPVLTFAYVTGWRLKSEVLPLQWRQVDFAAGLVRLEPGTTKNAEGRMFPCTPALRTCLEAQRAATDALQRQGDRIIPWVFHRDGAPIKHFRRAWRTACRAAGQPQLIPHDLRRSAVRNLERAGVPRSVAMTLVGHKTESVYRRYAIVDETMLRDGAAKLSALYTTEQAAAPTVVPLAAVRAAGGTSQVVAKSTGKRG